MQSPSAEKAKLRFNLARLSNRSSSTTQLFFGPFPINRRYNVVTHATCWVSPGEWDRFGAGSVGGFQRICRKLLGNKIRWDSCSAFLGLARETIGPARVDVEATLNWSELHAEDTLIIIHPETDLSFSETSAFLGAGGRVALLDDFGRGDDLLRRFQIQRVNPPAPLEGLDGNPALAVARPQISRAPNGDDLTHPIAEGVEGVVTNHPQALRELPGVELTRVLTYPTQSGEEVALAVVGVIGDSKACGLALPENSRGVGSARCGRLFAMADPSVFIDLMMTFPGNRQLASGLVRYLMERDVSSERVGRLYIIANRFTQTGHFGTERDLAKELISSLEKVHAAFRDLQTRGMPLRVAIGASLACAAIAAFWAWKTGGRLYRRPTPRYAQSPSLLSQGGLAGRSAVLAAPTTTEALRVLELKAALEAHFKAWLPPDSGNSFSQQLENLRTSGHLSTKHLTALSSLNSHFQKASESLSRGTFGNPHPRRVVGAYS